MLGAYYAPTHPRRLAKSYYKLKLRHSRENKRSAVSAKRESKHKSNLLFLFIFWIPAYAGMTVFFLGFLPNFNIDRVCLQSVGCLLLIHPRTHLSTKQRKVKPQRQNLRQTATRRSQDYCQHSAGLSALAVR